MNERRADRQPCRRSGQKPGQRSSRTVMPATGNSLPGQGSAGAFADGGARQKQHAGPSPGDAWGPADGSPAKRPAVPGGIRVYSRTGGAGSGFSWGATGLTRGRKGVRAGPAGPSTSPCRSGCSLGLRFLLSGQAAPVRRLTLPWSSIHLANTLPSVVLLFSSALSPHGFDFTYKLPEPRL